MRKIQWAKDFGPNHLGDRDFFSLAIISFIIIGLFIKEPILYIVIGLFLTYLTINHFYNRSIGEKLKMDRKRQTIRLFQGDKADFSFELENRSVLPMIHGQFRFQIESILEALEGDEVSGKMMHAFQKSFSIRARGKTSVIFPFQAKERGVARVRNISYTFPHLFNFNVLTLTYLPYHFIEVVVFPEPLKILGVEKAFQLSPGDHTINLSPFEDIQSPIGTRNYEYNDPFYRINWKASAKTQQLQTNVYEKVVDISYLFLVNVRYLEDGIQMNEEMEQILSYTAYICNKAMEAEVPYELYINARTASSSPYLHLPEGEGRTHGIRSLEMLARIPRHTMTYRFDRMVYRVKRQVVSPKTIVVIGHVPTEAIPLINEWTRTQRDIYQVIPAEDGAVMERWSKDVQLYA